jgi:AcrR family transcriptional regulator
MAHALSPQPTSVAPPHSAGRKAATQARILEAAVALFSVRGFERTSISAIASRAGVSRSAIFWHFSDKASLFQEAFRTLLVPFVEKLKESLEPLNANARFTELFTVYEQFVAHHRDRIETIVRWVLESRALRESLRKPLFVLHDEFAADVRKTLEQLDGDPERARRLAAGMMALMDGWLLLSFLDSDAGKQELRREGVRAIAELVLKESREDGPHSRPNSSSPEPGARTSPSPCACCRARCAGICWRSTASRASPTSSATRCREIGWRRSTPSRRSWTAPLRETPATRCCAGSRRRCAPASFRASPSPG